MGAGKYFTISLFLGAFLVLLYPLGKFFIQEYVNCPTTVHEIVLDREDLKSIVKDLGDLYESMFGVNFKKNQMESLVDEILTELQRKDIRDEEEMQLYLKGKIKNSISRNPRSYFETLPTKKLKMEQLEKRLKANREQIAELTKKFNEAYIKLKEYFDRKLDED